MKREADAAGTHHPKAKAARLAGGHDTASDPGAEAQSLCNRAATLSSTEVLSSITGLARQLAEPMKTVDRRRCVRALQCLAVKPCEGAACMAVEVLMGLISDSRADIDCTGLVLSSLRKICRVVDLDGWTGRVSSQAATLMSSGVPAHRAGAAQLLAAACSMDPEEAAKAERGLTRRLRDVDPRVVVAAARGLLVLHGRGALLGPGLYGTACEMARNEDTDVRLEAASLMWVGAQLHPESIVGAGEADDGVRIVDHCFGRLCDLVTDPITAVRQRAAALLGCFRGVSDHFLLQTLSKDIIQDMKIVGTGGKRRILNPASVSYNPNASAAPAASPPSKTNKAQASPPPVGSPPPHTEEDFSILNSGAAGAFIHALEDEFLEVRLAAIDSISELAMRAGRESEFATRALEFLVDMFNDEIDTVRSEAVNAVARMARGRVALTEEQLLVSLGCLEDSSFVLRSALHRLLGSTQMPTITALSSAVEALLKNMTKYPADVRGVFEHMGLLGGNHGSMTEFVAEGLLNIDGIHYTKEHVSTDPKYIAICALVLNAATNNPNILALLPPHVLRHHSYMRQKYPDLFPKIEAENIGYSCLTYQITPAGAAAPVDPASDSGSALDRAKDMVAQLVKLGPLMEAGRHADVIGFLQRTMSDVRRVSRVHDKMAGWGGIHVLYMEALRVTAMMAQGIAASRLDMEEARAMLRKVLAACGRMECLYTGVPLVLRAKAMGLCLLALLRYLYSAAAAGAVDSKTGADALLRHYSEQLVWIEKSVTFRDVHPELYQLLELCRSAVTMLEEGGSLGEYLRDCLPGLNAVLLLPDHCPASVKRLPAVITRPVDNRDSPDDAPVGPKAIALSATVASGLSTPSDISLRILYPSGVQRVVALHPRQFTLVSPGRYELSAEVEILLPAWSDAAGVTLALVRPMVSGGQADVLARQCSTELVDLYIPISQNVSYNIKPSQ